MRWHDGPVSIKSVRPRGTFHARRTRDGEARRRDGQTFVLINELSSSGPEQTFEIMFEDGVWMIAASDDLERI